ncbi:hypothetical protein SHL15_1190 [Streptomyces hygroscopicus subsp. limoneus]|nr:hypothetical protein SHL15_1190 [Streptomyces hygroscopicus subsp. limoneus]
MRTGRRAAARGLDAQLEQIAEQLRELATAKDRLQGLLEGVLAISRETDLPAVLHRIRKQVSVCRLRVRRAARVPLGRVSKVLVTATR